MTKPVTADQIKAVLANIADPSQNKDIISLGMLDGITVSDNKVMVTLAVPPHRGPAMEPLRQQIEAAIRNLDGVVAATVVITAHNNASAQAQKPTDKTEATPAKEKTLHSSVRRFIAIASGKGGVGKSTTATNLAIALKLEGLRVGLLDADVYGPSQPRMMGVSGRPQAVGGDMVAPLENYGVKVMSMGLLVPDETAMIWRGPMVQSALTQMLNAVVWGELDVIVIDLPPGTGDIQISLAQQVNLAGAVIVSTPQDIALLDVVKALTMFDKAEVKVLGFIQNMAVWVCPDCGRKDHIFGEGGAAREAEKRNISMLGEIPLSINIREASDEGKPIVVAEPKSPQAAEYRRIARQLVSLADLKAETPNNLNT